MLFSEKRSKRSHYISFLYISCIVTIEPAIFWKNCNSSNSNCPNGQFCNQDDPNFCEECYYPCDLDDPDAIERYEAVCGFCGDTTPSPMSPLPGPTVSPHSSDPPATSLGPTDCTKTIDWDVETDPSTSRPYFETSSSVFLATNELCTAHDNYMACTNENREDCQWIFLSGSLSRKGFCRVDPISKCIETGSCVCKTEDFQGGGTNLGEGILFHAPVSVTARDISSNRDNVLFTETFTPPTPENQDRDHPCDESFFISRVDFSHRVLHYEFAAESPIHSAAQTTAVFKLHYLYMDTPLIGNIWSGLGLKITIDTSKTPPEMAINGNTYTFSKPIKKWHCTQIVITPSHLFAAGNAKERNLSDEVAPTFTSEIHLGKFSGELFDVRIYGGILSPNEIREVGARCTNPNDPAVLNLHNDIETPILRGGCDPDIDPIPTSGGQTYSSGPFATFWMAPIQDEADEDVFHDIPEGVFDEDHLFQQAKLQSYAWEKWYFEADMIGFNQKPYRYFNSADETPGFSEQVWDNPCRYIHQHNNGWLFPFYGGDTIPKWDDPIIAFDLGYLFHNRGFDGYGFVVHETFHGMQGELTGTYNNPLSRFLAESTASFGADIAFPATQTYSSPYTIAHALPLNFFTDRDIFTNPHFGSIEISINDAIRGGHIYAAFLFWSFLSNHAGMPHIVGEMHSIVGTLYKGQFGGELLALRMFVENEGFDLGDIFGVFLAHLRTWDYPRFAVNYIQMERNDFESYSTLDDWPLSSSLTLEDLKTDVKIDANIGTSGEFISGPTSLRPGQFGWNCLTIENVNTGKFVIIKIAWDGLGTDSSNPSELHELQAGCDDDIRFYNSMVVAHNIESGERRYWKMKGKTPAEVVIDVGSSSPVTIHVLMVPTPPADYVDSEDLKANGLPFPAYNYRYSVRIIGTEPADGSTVSNEKKNGIVKFEPATPGWWSTRCTCTVLSDDLSGCSVPIFDIQGPTVNPTSQTGSTFIPTAQPTSSTSNPTVQPTGSTLNPNLIPSDSPTFQKCFNTNEKFVLAIRKNGIAKLKSCDWLESKGKKNREKICKKRVSYYEKENETYSPAQIICQQICSSCAPCYENLNSKFFDKKAKGVIKIKTCKHLKNKRQKNKYCNRTQFKSGYPPAKEVCPQKCSTITKVCDEQ